MSHSPCLGLVPADTQLLVPEERLLDAIRHVGLIDKHFDYRGRTHFSLGDRFFSLVSFLGCMPFLVLDPEEGMAGGELGFCHAELVVTPGHVGRWIDENTRVFKCANCGRPHDLVNDAVEADGVSCSACSTLKPWSGLRLGDTGAVARTALIIHGVHRAEGVPGTELLEALAGTSDGVPWRYFYLG